MGQAKARGSFEQRQAAAIRLNSTKVEYSYEEPGKPIEKKTFETLTPFLLTPVGRLFREVLLTNNLIFQTRSITIETVFPSIIKMTFIKDESL